MRAGKAFQGFYTVVEVIIRLTNDRDFSYSWTTPMALSRALHKAPVWAKQELRKAQIKGRSKIMGISVEARYKVGAYKR